MATFRFKSVGLKIGTRKKQRWHVASVFFLFVVLWGACSKREPHQYNVLLVTLDTFRADRLSAATPNLQRFAAAAIRFENSSSPVPLTLPAHASILSSLLPLTHGLRNNGAGSFPADRPTLATVFRAAGYRSGAFVSAFVLDHRFGLDRGFDVYDDAIARDPNSTSQFEAERRGAETVDRAIAFLRQSDPRPSFTWVHLYDAHAPYEPPAPYPQTYDGEIAYVDLQLGRLFAAVDPATTIVAVVGDHGESLGEHGELTHGLLLYEPTLHVPMMARVPSAEPRAVREPVSSTDLAPTLATLAGASFPAAAHLDGRDLSKQIAAGKEPDTAVIYAETQYPAIFGWSDLAVLRRGNFKYIASPAPEVYDLGHDPKEARNVLTDERRRYRELSAQLETLRSHATVRPKPSPLDDEARAKLASLGYVAPTSLTESGGARPDPAAMAPLFRQFEEATWASNGNRPDEAIATFRSLVARDPKNPVFRGSLARALRKKGELAAAITLYQESVAIAPGDPEAWYNLAIALQEAGRGKEGGIAIREAIRRDPGRPEAHNALGISFSTEGDFKTAQEEFEKALAMDPQDARAYNNLGNVYRATGRTGEAAAAYQRALVLAPRYADALNGLGVTEVQRDQPRLALVHFELALRVAPRFYEAQLNRGIALQLAGNRKEAELQFRRLLAELPPGSDFAGPRQAAAHLLAGLEK